MRQRHDSFTKKFLRRVLDSEGTFTAEVEVSPDAQRFDGYFVPHRAHAARRRDRNRSGVRKIGSSRSVVSS
jgi:hypothetical protein